MTSFFYSRNSGLALGVLGAVVTLGVAAGVAPAAPRRPALTVKAPAKPAPARVDFNMEVRPILADRCFSCHGFDPGQRQAGLRLDTAEGALLALSTGHRAVVPGKPGQSEALKRVVAGTMPPPGSKKALTTQETEILRRWISQGAQYAAHWALVPPRRPSPPTFARPHDRAWLRNSLDTFILARLQREGLRPSPPADRPTLLRRVSLDLTGLPPTPAEVDAFLADRSPDAYEKVVDRLLGSPRYGERMAWDWLDAARYADTNGYQGDGTRTMWPWRNWVIQAFNRNLPFDQFTVEQLAGDLLPNPTPEQRIATGFNRNHMLNGEGGRIAEESRVDYVVDRVDTTSTVWLGLTVGCARCHDHKYDPLAQREYYQFYAYFNNLPETGGVDRGGQANPVLELPTPEQTEAVTRLKAALAEKESRLTGLPATAPEEEKKAAQAERDAARKALQDARNAILTTMVMEERPQPRETHLLVRGAYDKYGERVHPGVPAVLPSLPADAPTNRLALARWLVDPGNPLTARVTVNRFWQQIFGTGLVKTSEDFGVQGERPSHPELLDWLATEFIRTGWDTKGLLRLLVTSATYKQSSRVTPALREHDPENRLLARGARYRLSSAMLRDQALAVSGLLVEKVGGPSVKTYQPEGVWEDATFGQIKYQQDHGESLHRRTLYTFWRRIVGPTNLFDAATRQNCTVRLARTNTPLHALTLLNDPTYVEAARMLAQRALTTGGTTLESRVELAFRLATSRRPTVAERGVLLQSLGRLRVQYAADAEATKALLTVGEAPRDAMLDTTEHAAYTALCGMILNLDEVVTKE